MRILMIAGASRSVVWFRKELIKFLIDKGNDIIVVACDSDNQTEIESYGVRFICADGDNRDTGILSNLKYIKTVKNIVKEVEPDKIMTFQVKANTFGVIGAKQAKHKDITAMIEGLGSVFNGRGFKNKILRIITLVLYKFAFNKVKTVILLNTQNQEFLKDKNIIKDNQCMLINGIGVDLNKFKRQEEIPTDTIKFVMVARVEKEKGVVEYCEAAKRIIDCGGKNVEFNYYGNCDTINNPLDEYKDYVNYHGYTKDIKSVLEQNHIIVLPSYHEGVPRSLMEACAMSMPLIATDIAGCRVCLNDNYNGKLVEMKSIEDLVQKIQWFIDNKSQIVLMGKASRNIAEEKLDSNIINSQIWERLNG